MRGHDALVDSFFFNRCIKIKDLLPFAKLPSYIKPLKRQAHFVTDAPFFFFFFFFFFFLICCVCLFFFFLFFFFFFVVFFFVVVVLFFAYRK